MTSPPGLNSERKGGGAEGKRASGFWHQVNQIGTDAKSSVASAREGRLDLNPVTEAVHRKLNGQGMWWGRTWR
ncbi:hypothetical protein NPIL_672061 [Nephila pilipes]|uniref:Uncharacterized protein n=1 Tax=Nephila pilipes TaxID=299642 RepID=A0A8X6NS53_NEPPI|nr:hypothetical protein NPIL_672061 [Nephila pilipes]